MGLEERVAVLRSEVGAFHLMQQKRHGRNFTWHWLFVVLVLACSMLTALAGILKWPHSLIAITGIASATFVALHTALATGDKAEFQRVVASDAANLLLDLRAGDISEQRLDQLLGYFKELRKHADAQLPTGGGMDAVRNLPRPPGAA